MFGSHGSVELTMAGLYEIEMFEKCNTVSFLNLQSFWRPNILTFNLSHKCCKLKVIEMFPLFIGTYKLLVNHRICPRDQTIKIK